MRIKVRGRAQNRMGGERQQEHEEEYEERKRKE
jgi:hypothetical protein